MPRRARVYCGFDAGAAKQLAELLKAAALFAVGGMAALEKQKDAGIVLLIEQLRTNKPTRTNKRKRERQLTVNSLEFNEDFYLWANPDVQRAIKEGVIVSAQEHFERFGKAEGRRGVPVIHSAATASSLQAIELTPELIAAAERNGSAMQVSPAISPADFILSYIIAKSPESHRDGGEGGVSAYFSSGKNDAEQVARLIYSLGLTEQSRILEFASGYGRVSRHMTSFNLTSSDIHEEANLFTRDSIGLPTLQSTLDPDLLETNEKFDFIFVLSLFSHLPDNLFGKWLNRLIEMLLPGGFLMFTTHGELGSSPDLRDSLSSNGIGYLAISDQHDLSLEMYGSTIVTPEYVVARIKECRNAHLHSFQAGAWWRLQDQWIVRAV
jgi:SAM-dependent methyltransferase